MKKTVFTEGVVEGLRKWKGRAKKKVARRQRGQHGCDYNFSQSPPRTSVDAGVDSPPSFRLEATPMASVDYYGRLQLAGANNNKQYNNNNNSCSAAVSVNGDEDKLKGKKPIEEADQKSISLDAFDWANKIHRNFSRHAM